MITEQQQLEIKYLLELNHSGTISPAQTARLLSYMETYWRLSTAQEGARAAKPAVFKDFMEQAWRQSIEIDEGSILSENDKQLLEAIDWDHMYQRITGIQRKSDAIPVKTGLPEKEGALSSFGTKRGGAIGVIKWAAAALLLFTLGFASWWVLQKQKSEGDMARQQVTNDLPAPSSAKAILILADGSKVVLDSSSNGRVAAQGNTSILLNGKNNLSYELAAGSQNGLVRYNELRVLKGSQPLSITLSDGSKVWLNVGSSLRYPTAFDKNNREVVLNGEAYFEVRHDRNRPFIVHHEQLAVKVLGTHFNINSYADEPNLKVTLIQGAVEVDRNHQQLLLHPGEQAVAKKEDPGALVLNKQVDLDQVLAWKTSEFIFGPGTDFKAIMRQIARWYDVDVRYTAAIQTKFWGSIPRTVGIGEVLQLLEATGGVRFKLTGRQLKVMPVH